MNYRVIERNGASYVECFDGQVCLRDERDALDWVAVCGEQGAGRLMIHAANLTGDFFDLSTGVAGAILLKFSTYRIKLAAVLTPELAGQGRFREMVLETNRGNHFRVFYRREDAEAWLVNR